MKSHSSRLVLKNLERSSIVVDSGFCFVFELLETYDSCSGFEMLDDGWGVLFEDAVEIGPGHTQHATIRVEGKGAYSFYGNKIWFSASDNTDPRSNGKTYSVLLTKNSPEFYSRSRSAYIQSLSKYERYNLAKYRFKKIWPNLIFPDCGRLIDREKGFIDDYNLACPEAVYSLDRKYALNEFFKLAHRLEGDVAECGTYRGASAFFLVKSINRFGLTKDLFLFDSFMGLSEPGPCDGSFWVENDLSASQKDVWDNLSRAGGTSFVKVLEGWIPNRFDEVKDRKFCFVHLDVDLAQPTVDSLEFFYPRMVSGGLILIDDYGFDTCPGVTHVVDEFMKFKTEAIVKLVSGGCLIIKV